MTRPVSPVTLVPMVNGAQVYGWYSQAKQHFEARYEGEPPLWVGGVIWGTLILVVTLLIGWLS